MPTMQQVADAAGVSIATVSRALTTPQLVHEDTRKLIMAVVDRLGYAPNFAAKTLRTTRSQKIIVTVPDISNPFFSSVIRGVEEAAQEAGYAVLLGDTRDEPEREDQYGTMLRRKEADGIIFLGRRIPNSVAPLVRDKKSAAPVVNACESSPELGVTSVHIDNLGAAYQAINHIYDQGHQRVGIITGAPESPLNQDRMSGVLQGARERGLKHLLSVAIGDFSIGSGAKAAADLLGSGDPPTAIFCFSDEMAMGTLAALRERGMRCPDQVSVVGFDDLRFSAFTDPPLTTIRQPAHEIGREAVKGLLGVLEGSVRRVKDIVLPHMWIARASLGPAPVPVVKPKRARAKVAR